VYAKIFAGLAKRQPLLPIALLASHSARACRPIDFWLSNLITHCPFPKMQLTT
jgi:hypothetical protein